MACEFEGRKYMVCFQARQVLKLKLWNHHYDDKNDSVCVLDLQGVLLNPLAYSAPDNPHMSASLFSAAPLLIPVYVLSYHIIAFTDDF